MSADALPSPTAEEVSTHSKSGRILLALALVSGLVHCAPLLSDVPLALDEHASYWTIDPETGTSVWDLCQRYLATPPLGHWVQQFVVAVCGASERTLRAPSAVALLLSILVVYRIGAGLGSTLTGGAAALILAWHPLVLDEVRIARCYGLVVLLSACLVDVTLRWTRSDDQQRWAWVWGVTAALLVWTHYVAIPFVGLCWFVPAGTWLLQGRLRPRTMASLLLAAGLSIALCWPLLPAVLRVHAWGDSWHLFATRVPVLDLIGSDWWLGLPLAIAASWLTGRTGGPATKDTPSATGWRITAAQLALLAFGLTVAGAAAQWAGQSSLASSRYRTSSAVPGALLFAHVLTWRPWFRNVLAAALVGIVATWSVLDHFPWRAVRLGNPMDYAWHDMALAIEAEGAPGEPVFIQAGVIEGMLLPAFYEDSTFDEYIAFAMSRFYLRADHPRYGLPYHWQRPAEMAGWYRQRMNARPGGRTWLAAAADTDLNQASIDGFDAIARRTGLTLESKVQFGPAVLRCYIRPAP